ncbi:DUF4314 domain-containing protein [Streptomyces sp. M54]|nr:DUF4314 domain-containing protein [Streptomyces sp. M54]
MEKGGRVELVHTTDEYTELRPGDQGTVTRWDARLGHLEIRWDTGSKLAIIPELDDEVQRL